MSENKCEYCDKMPAGQMFCEACGRRLVKAPLPPPPPPSPSPSPIPEDIGHRPASKNKAVINILIWGVVAGVFWLHYKDYKESLLPQTPVPDMVFVKGGTFTMGCTYEQGGDCYDEERPAHSVTLGDFHIGKYPVTQAQWVAVMRSNPSSFKGNDSRPVETVSWNDVQEFIKKLNLQSGRSGDRAYRLPTEAEWEYAARGGSSSRGYKYSGSNTISDVAWYSANSGSKTRPVGGKAPNELGIYDMSGNVLEWINDWYGSYTSDANTNPNGPSSGSYRVNRGGGWGDDAIYCRVSDRAGSSPGDRRNGIGFRLAVSSGAE